MGLEQAEDAHPAGYTIDGVPWDEPRGPHLPDAITRQPLLIWPFLALAALIVEDEAVRVAHLGSITPDIVARSIVDGIASVAAVLLGAAWFWRHRRPADQPLMAAGLTLLAVLQGMRFVTSWVVERATALSGSGDDPFATIRWGGIWSTLEGALSIVALLLLFRAVSEARRRPAAARQRVATIAIAALATAVIALLVWSTWRSTGIADDEFLQVNFSGTLRAAVVIVVSAVVAAQLVAGALAGETPRIAWRLGAAGFVLPLIASFSGWVAIASGSTSPDFFVQFQWFQLIVVASGAIALLAAVLLGLPSGVANRVERARGVGV